MSENYLKKIVLLGSLIIFTKTPFAASDKTLINGKLAPCPDKPNCVCTENNGISPVSFDMHDPEEAWLILQSSIEKLGGKIENVDSDYLWATFKTPVLKFTDDIEARLDSENKVIHLRSASRVGHYDFNTNRNRLKRLIEIISIKLNPDLIKNSHQ